MKTLFTALTASIVCIACAEKPEPITKLRPVAWTTVANAMSLPTTKYSGVLTASEHAPLAFEVAGVVQAVNVDVGDTFSAGDVLAELTPLTYSLRLTQRQAELEEATASLVLANQEYQRARRLVARGATSQAQFDKAKAQRNAAKSRSKTAKASVALAQQAIADTKIIAPYSGLLSQRLVEPAQRVQAGQTSLHIQSDTRPFEVTFSVAEQELGQIRRGDRFWVYLPALDARTESFVVEKGIAANAGSAYPVTLQIIESVPGSQAGMTAEVFASPTIGGSSPLSIPATAFAAHADGSRYALVLEPLSIDGDSQSAWRVVRRTIELARVTTQQAEVKHGLTAGETVVSRGLVFLADGDSVTRLNDGPREFAE